jgi:hypothetical protein
MKVDYCSNIDSKDLTIISNILNKTSFELEGDNNSVFNKKVGDYYYYFVFTKNSEIIDPLLFAYSVKLEPIQIYNLPDKEYTVICFKSQHKYKHSEVELVLSQMIANSNFFRFPEQCLTDSIDNYIQKLSIEQSKLNDFTPEQLFSIKLLFATGYVYHVNFNFDKIISISSHALDIALQIVGKDILTATVDELRKVALTEYYYNKVCFLETKSH